MEFRKIFTHIDDDGDEISFFSDERSPLSVEVKPVGEQSYIGYLDRDAALRLHTALGEWLYPVHTPEGPNRSLIEQMIERAVRDQVAAVLPLHLKTVARVCSAQGCQVTDEAEWPQHGDPESRDVGHPTYEDARPHPAAPECGKCSAPWSDTHGQPGDPCAPAPSAPAPAGPTWDDELWSAPSAETSARTLPVPACPECGHSWRAHSPHSTAPYCIQRTGGTRDCECTRVRP